MNASKKIRICFLGDGQSIHTQRLCLHFVGRGHTVYLISFKPVELPGVDVHFVNAGNIDSGGGNWKVLFKVPDVRSLLKIIKPDVLHALYATSYGLVGALTGYHPFLVTALGTDVLISPQQSFLYRMIVKYVLKHADRVTTMGEHMKEAVVELGIDGRKVQSILFGINGDIFNMMGKSVPEKEFVITSTRNFEPVYSIETIVDAASMLKDEIPELRINFIGDGSGRNEVKERVIAAGLEKQATFFGRIPQPEIAGIMRSGHVFVSMSLSDGNNISLNEAMACGVYSIVSDITANRFWIKEGVNGELVPIKNSKVLADKILYFYRHYKAFNVQAMYEYNKNILEKYAMWDINMLQLENKYLELCRS